MQAADAKALVQNLSASPGVYRMLDEQGQVLYVGKARNLRKRVASYFRATGLSGRIQRMVRSVASIDVTVTNTENEALLLENNLIKSLLPRYNILLRDDKSYPYIFLSAHEFPRLGFHRGAKREAGQYFGPFPSASSVRESLGLLQKVFPVRQCEDSFFRNRSRPCLQYQIKRCTAPCVGFIERAVYADDVRHASMFLDGKSQVVIDEMASRMEQAAARQDYEDAARYRDRIAALRSVQERQYVSSDGGDADVLALAQEQGGACVSVTFIRNGHNLGNKNFFPRLGGEAGEDDILAAFLPQYYLGKPVPAVIYLNVAIPDRPLLEEVFTQQAGHKVKLVAQSRGLPRRWIKLAELNARDALRRHLSDQANIRSRFESLQEALGLDAVPERIECFDISHTQGEATVASCVVFGPEGPVKSAYRRYNIEGIQPGDDYAAMTQALTRRYRRALEQDQEGGAPLPDLVLIDGGKGQLRVAEEVMQELSLEGVRLVGVAKGVARKPGQEQLFLSSQSEPTILPPDSSALHLIQQVRDEAHRFAITGHRQRRGKARLTSSLEDIPGIGDKRRQALLRQLGGLQQVMRAGVDELTRVPGISPALAQRIYDTYHETEN
jgi:excinuclease ABC subunit C